MDRRKRITHKDFVFAPKEEKEVDYDNQPFGTAELTLLFLFGGAITGGYFWMICHIFGWFGVGIVE